MGAKKNFFVHKLNLLHEQRHLYSIRTALISLMPLMIVGAYAAIINNLPIAAYQNFMEGFFGPRWRIFGELIFNSTTQIVTFMVVFLICSNLAKWYNVKKSRQVSEGICGLVGLSCYVAVSLPIEGTTSFPLNIVGVNGLFVAMVVSIIAGEAMIWFSGRKSSLQLLSDDLEIAVPQSFASIAPAILVIGCFGVLRLTLVYAGISDSLPEIVNKVLQLPFRTQSPSLGAAVLYSVATHFMWLFGIHGSNVLDKVAQTVFVTGMEANAAAAAAGLSVPNLITKTMFDTFVYMGGCGTTLALVAALLIFGKRRRHHKLMGYALPNSIFNINEPLIFGVPVVLNPFYAIPFIFTPVIMLLTTTFAMKLGWVPYTISEVSWATPVFVSGYLATRSSAGVILQLVNLIIAVAIYAPFVRLADKMGHIRFQNVYQQLLTAVIDDYAVSAQRFTTRVDEVGAAARHLANQLDLAIKKKEMYLDYQPIVNVARDELHSVEALLRWKHPVHGQINPMVTVTLAEETGRMLKMGQWILEQAIDQRARWTRWGVGDFPVSVNMSSLQLDSPLFTNQIIALLNKYRVPASQLQIEITESAALVENATSSRNLQILAQAGITIAMDDFGVGHSPLLYLRAHPITALKIDGSLSRGVVETPQNLDIIATIYDLCHLLKVDTIIEYVDNVAQLEKLREIGITLVQGYLYSPPLAAEAIPKFIASLPQRNYGQTQIADK